MGATGDGKTDEGGQGADAGEGQDGNAGAGGAANEGNEGGKGFDANELHPALRGMKPAEITELFETMATTIREVQRPPVRTEPVREAPPPKRQRTKEDWKALLDPNSDQFDPESVVTEIADRNYGKLLGDINTRAVRGMLSTFRTEFHDFQDHEAEVMKAFAGVDPTQISESQIMQAYLTSKGLKQLQKERQESKQKSTTTRQPTPTTQAAAKETELSEAEVTIARKMFRRAADPIAEYKKFAKFEDGMEVGVPLGGGKKG